MKCFKLIIVILFAEVLEDTHLALFRQSIQLRKSASLSDRSSNNLLWSFIRYTANPCCRKQSVFINRML